MRNLARAQLSAHFAALFNRTVTYGPFKGLKLHENAHWGSLDLPAMLLGLYEKELLDIFAAFPPGGDFIDIGSADGYYAVGALVSGTFDRTLAFELTESGQASTLQTAVLNGVTERIRIHGAAEAVSLLSVLDAENARPCLVLIDIEGVEFDLLTDAVLQRMASATIIIELHEFIFKDGTERRSHLINRASRWFDHTVITTGPRDLSTITELRSLHDDYRWLVCSEGRPRAMEWLVLKPRLASVFSSLHSMLAPHPECTPQSQLFLTADGEPLVVDAWGNYYAGPVASAVGNTDKPVAVKPALFELKDGRYFRDRLSIDLHPCDSGGFQIGRGVERIHRSAPSGGLVFKPVMAGREPLVVRPVACSTFARLDWLQSQNWLDPRQPNRMLRFRAGEENVLTAGEHRVSWHRLIEEETCLDRVFSEGRLRTDDAVELRLFRPLVYYNVFGKVHMFEMMRLSMLTLERFSGVELSYLIVSDRDESDVSEFVAQSAKSRTRFVRKSVADRNAMLTSRYEIESYPLAGYAPVLYLDVDILCNASIAEMLGRMLCDDRLHIGTEYRGQTQGNIGLNAKWYGQFLFMMAKMPFEQRLCYNSGAICFNHPSLAKPHFEETLYWIRQFIASGSPAVNNLGDQPFFSFVAQKNDVATCELMDKLIDIVFVQERSVLDEGTPLLGLIHFNRGVGSEAKLEHMLRYYISLMSQAHV